MPWQPGTAQHGGSRLAGGPRRGDAIGRGAPSRRSERCRSRAVARRRARRGVSGAGRGGGAAEAPQATGGKGAQGNARQGTGESYRGQVKDGESDEMCPSSSRSTE